MGMKASREWRFSQHIEELVRYLLMQQGEKVLPASAIETGNAPMLVGLVKKLISPDLLTAMQGKCRWVDVKGKARTTLFGKSRTIQTGAPIRVCKAYREVQEETGIPCWLYFVHANEVDVTTGLICVYKQSLDVLRKNYHHTDPSGGNGIPTVYWDIDTFIWEKALSFRLAEEIRKGTIPPKSLRSWETTDSLRQDLKQNRFDFNR